MSQDVTIRMPDGTTRQISDTHETKSSSVTTPGGKTIEVVEWTPKDELSPAQKRAAPMRARALDFVNAKPGCAGTDLPQSLRRFLYTLEDAGTIEFSSGGWVATPDEGLEKARHDSASWDELSSPRPAADRLAELNTELLSLLRRARQIQRAQFQNIQVRRDAAAFGRNERELEEKIWPRVAEIREALRAAELADDAERGFGGSA